MTDTTTQQSCILVTGGLGFIGSHTVVELIQAGYRVVVVDDLSNSRMEVLTGIEKITGVKPFCYVESVLNTLKLSEIMRSHKVSAVIHFAAFKAVGESVQKPLEYYKNNVGGLMSLLESMRSVGIKDLVFSSSCTVYGQPENLPVNENSPIQKAESPYGSTKIICETILSDLSANSEIKAISLRYFNPVGAHPSSEIGELPLGVPNNLVPYITQTAAGIREELTIFGSDYDTPDGTCIRDYIHVVDLAKAHVKALEFAEDMAQNYEVFNIGTGYGNTVLEVVKCFEDVSGRHLKYHMGQRRPGDVEKVWSDCEKANKMLKWHATLGLEDMMTDAWNWQLRQS